MVEPIDGEARRDLAPAAGDTGMEEPAAPGAAPGKTLTPAAVRALEEAAARRTSEAARAAGEAGGPQGLEPTRFGDWERKGLAVDF